MHTQSHSRRWLAYALVAVALVVAAGGAAAYAFYLQYNELAQTRTEFAHATSTLEADIRSLNDRLAAADATNVDLQTLLHAQREENVAYGVQVQSLASTVAQLDKLSKTDRELLQKYSAVYFLNENFVPQPLSVIDPAFTVRDGVILEVHASVYPFLEKLLRAAKADGTPLRILSAFRSFGTQAGLKTSYKVTYGAGTANQFSADQGYSEHQLGSTVDFSTPEGGTDLQAFEGTEGHQWLVQNAHRFGFILSYPEGNTYFTFEPWHWRFVGVELATRLRNEGKHFYDLDQREINEYLIKIFD